VTGYNDFDLDQVLVFLMPGFSCYFRTLLPSVAALILTSNFSCLAEVGNLEVSLVNAVSNVDQPGGGLCNTDRCYKSQYLYKALGKCFISYIYRNVVRYCTWYNHSIRIRYSTYSLYYRHTGTYILSACFIS